MNNVLSNPVVLALAAVALLLIGWVACKAWAARAPSKRTIALKAALLAIKELRETNAPLSPEAAAAEEAKRAHDAALLSQLKDQLTKI